MAVSSNFGIQQTTDLPLDQRQPFDYGLDDGTGGFGNSIARGVDTLQASLYSATTVIGELTGFDALTEWGEDGVEKNMQEIMANPPTIHSWDDVDSLSDFANYFMEALGEQIPSLGLDAALLVGGVATGGATWGAIAARRAGMTMAQKAAIGKGLKRKVGERAFDEFGKRKLAQYKKAGGAIAFAGSAIAQGTGESQMELKEEGITSPLSAIISGTVKGGLDLVGLDRLFKLSKAVGQSPRSVGMAVGKIAAAIGVTGGTEAVTEGLQTITDKLMVKAHTGEDVFSEDNLREIKESMIKGGLVGGTLGGGVSGMVMGAQYSKHKAELAELERADNARVRAAEEVASVEDAAAPVKDTPTSESQGTIDAMARAMLDPTSSKDTIEVTTGSPEPTAGIMPDHIFKVETENGVAYTTNPEKRDLMESTGGTEAVMGEVLFDKPNGKANADGSVVVARDAAGIPVSEVASSPEELEADIETAQRIAPEGGVVEVSDTVTQLEERQTAVVDEGEPRKVREQAELGKILDNLTPEQRQEVTDVMGAGGPEAKELSTALAKAVKGRLKEEDDFNARQGFDQASSDFQNADEGHRDLIDEGLNVPDDTQTGNQLIPERPDAMNRGGKGFDTEEQANDVVGKLATDPSIAERQVVKEGDTFFIQQITLPEQLAPEPVVSAPNTKSPQGRPDERSESVLIADAITDATKGGAKRARLSLKDRGKQDNAAMSMIMTVLGGKKIPMTVMDLTSAGMELLKKRQLGRDLNEGQFRLEAFTTMLGELIQQGYRVSDAFDLDNMTPKQKANVIKGNINSAPLRPSISLVSGNIKEGTGDFQTIADVEDNNRKSERGENETLLKLRRKEKEGTLTQDDEEQLAIAEKAKDSEFDPSRDENKVDTVEDEVASAARTVSGPVRKNKEGFIKKTDTAARDNKKPASQELSDGAEAVNSESNNSVLQNDAKQDNSGEKLGDLDRSRPKRSISEKPGDKKRQTILTRGLDKAESAFVRGIIADLGLDNVSFAITTPDDMKGVGLTDKEAAEVKARFDSDPNLKGTFIPKGKYGVIVVRQAKDKSERLSRMATLAHEIGHGILNASEASLTTFQRAQLQKAFEKDRHKSKSYEGEGGFKEWYSDQVAAYALNLNTGKPQERKAIFRGVADQLKRIWRALMTKLHEETRDRFMLNQTFSDYIKEAKHRNVFKDAQSFGVGQAENMIDMDAPIVKDVFTDDGLRSAVRRLATKVGDIAGMPLIGRVFSSDGQIRAIAGKAFANRFYQETHSTVDQESWQGGIDKERDVWEGQLNQIHIKYRRKLGVIATKGALKFGKLKKSAEQLGYDLMVAEAYDQLAKELDTDKLNPMAKDIRRMIQRYHRTYLTKRIPGIGLAQKYFPRMYDTLNIQANPAAFQKILDEFGIKNIPEVMNHLAQTDPLQGSTEDMQFVPGGNKIMKQRMFTDPKMIEALVEAGFLNSDPFAALQSYIHTSVKRAEFTRVFHSLEKLNSDIIKLGLTAEAEKRLITLTNHSLGLEHTKVLRNPLRDMLGAAVNYHTGREINGRDGESAFSEAQDRFYKKFGRWTNDAEYQRVKKLIMDAAFVEADINSGVLDDAKEIAIARNNVYVTSGLEKLLEARDKKNQNIFEAIGQIRAFESFRTLAFSGVASIPEAGAIYTRAKGTLGKVEYAKDIINTIKNFAELREFAEALGAIKQEVSAAMATEMYGPGTISRKGIAKFLPKLFEYNGNNMVVEYSRVMAAVTAKKFITNESWKVLTGEDHGLGRSKRYLAELGITAEQVQIWNDNDQNLNLEGLDAKTAEATEAVIGAMNRFVNESIIRPNASERPTWADHPLGSLVFHLKTFAYTYNKNIMMGGMREVGNKIEERGFRGLGEATPFIFGSIFVFMFMGALSEEMRQRILSLGRQGAWGKAKGDTGKLFENITNRSGLNSMPFLDALRDPSIRNVSFALGPTISHSQETLAYGVNVLTKDNPGRTTLNFLMKSTPVLSQHAETRKMLRERLTD